MSALPEEVQITVNTNMRLVQWAQTLAAASANAHGNVPVSAIVFAGANAFANGRRGSLAL